VPFQRYTARSSYSPGARSSSISKRSVARSKAVSFSMRTVGPALTLSLASGAGVGSSVTPAATLPLPVRATLTPAVRFATVVVYVSLPSVSLATGLPMGL